MVLFLFAVWITKWRELVALEYGIQENARTEAILMCLCVSFFFFFFSSLDESRVITQGSVLRIFKKFKSFAEWKIILKFSPTSSGAPVLV